MISIVLLNYNSGEFIDQTVDGIAQQSCRNFECIVVDNGSTDDSLSRICKRFDAHQMCPETVQLDDNLHFAAGMNAGIRQASGEVIVALNSDVVLDSEYTARLSQAYRQSQQPDEGSFCGLQYLWDWPANSLTRCEVGYGISLSRRVGVRAWDERKASCSKLLGPSGCAPAFTKTALEATRLPNGDYFDTRFVAFGEDLDLLLRMRTAGYRPVVVPGLRYWHIGSASYSNGVKSLFAKSPQLIGQVLANKWRIWRKLPTKLDRAITFPAASLYDLTVMLWLLATRGAVIGEAFRAYCAGLRRICHEEVWGYRTSPRELRLYWGLW